MMVETPPRNLVMQPDGALVPEPEAPVPSPAKSRAFERLHLLVRKGYVPEIGTETAADTIVLRHLGKAPDLVLHSDGLVRSRSVARGTVSRNFMNLRCSASRSAAIGAGASRFLL